MLSIFKRKHPQFFTAEEQSKIVHAIKQAELRTSGEVRVFVESKCRFVNPLDRAAEVFFGLKMEVTSQRNAVLVYVAVKDRQLAVFADEGIYQKAGKVFWNNAVIDMLAHFDKDNYAEGIVHIVLEAGASLATHFPHDGSTDKNELPDEIVFGK